jgi:hypothetical protein
VPPLVVVASSRGRECVNRSRIAADWTGSRSRSSCRGRVGITHEEQRTSDKRLGLHWQGRRTALPRHRTLHALLDWSYSVLPESERSAQDLDLRRAHLEAAQAVARESAWMKRT